MGLAEKIRTMRKETPLMEKMRTYIDQRGAEYFRQMDQDILQGYRSGEKTVGEGVLLCLRLRLEQEAVKDYSVILRYAEASSMEMEQKEKQIRAAFGVMKEKTASLQNTIKELEEALGWKDGK